MDEEAKNVASKPAIPGSNPGGRTTPEANTYDCDILTSLFSF
jgi:hypothetical protein